MAAKGEKDAITGVETTGHEWDGIKELNNPLPRWWVYTFYVCIAHRRAAGGSSIPSWPLDLRLSAGRARLQPAARSRAPDRRGQGRAGAVDRPDRGRWTRPPSRPTRSWSSSRSPAARRTSRPTARPATAWAARARASSRPWPTTTGSGAGPSTQIEYTIRHGIRNGDDPDARDNAMPAFGADGLLDKEQIADVTQYVLSLTQRQTDAEAAARGAAIFAENCASCHGEARRGRASSWAARRSTT